MQSFRVFASLPLRVRRSYSLKAKISENVGIFVLALKRKKVCFFALFACKRNTPNSEKKLKRNKSEAKREAKNYYSSKSLKVSLLVFPYNLCPKASQTPPSSRKGIIIPLYPLSPQQGLFIL
jgi:hypothetical protein